MEENREVRQFKLIGGHPSVDFINTVGAWIANPGKNILRDYRDVSIREKLDSYDDLVAWGQHIGFLNVSRARHLLRQAQRQPNLARSVLKRGIRLREALYRLFRSFIKKWPPEPADIECLNKELSIARGHQSLISRGNKLEWDWHAYDAMDQVLWPLARSAAELLSSENVTRLRQCGGDDCGWLFLDTSRNGSRQWCEMRDCGNLAKVRRFRRRQKSEGVSGKR